MVARLNFPFFVPGTIIPTPVAGHLGINLGLRARIYRRDRLHPGTHNIGVAASGAYGDADLMIAGGAGTRPRQPPSVASVWPGAERRNDDPHAASRPWDQDRDGFVLSSDGAGAWCWRNTARQGPQCPDHAELSDSA